MSRSRRTTEELYGDEIRAEYELRAERRGGIRNVEHDRLLVLGLAQRFKLSTKRVRDIIGDDSVPPPVLSNWEPGGNPPKTARNRAIVKAHDSGKATVAKLAAKHGISEGRVHQIIQRRSYWLSLPEDKDRK